MRFHLSIKWMIAVLTSLTLSIGAAEKPSSEATAKALREKYPPRVEDLRPTSGWAPRFHRPVVVPERKRVPLKVDWADNEASDAMVTFGVPFARGALSNVENIRIVDADGNAVPCGFRSVATWGGPNGPVRWALGHAELSRGRDYFLEFGTKVEPNTAKGVEIVKKDDAIIVDTGPARFTISRNVPSVLETVALDFNKDGKFSESEEIVKSENSAKNLPVVVDGEGKRYVVEGGDAGFKTEVVESGPARVAVRREGWYADGVGNRFCQFITYTYFHAGQSSVRHDHTLVLAFDTNKHVIRDVMLPVPLDVAAAATVEFATDESPGGAPVELPVSEEPCRLVQDRHDHWALTSEKGVVKSGSRAGGWFGLRDSQWGAFGGLSDFWKQYPAELEVADNALRFHLWPAHGGKPLNLRPSFMMGADYPGNHVFASSFYRAGLDEMTQGYGVGKTHNVYLNFFPVAKEDEARKRIRADVVKPVLALPDPAYVCSTEAFFGRAHPYDPERFPKIEKLLDSIVETYREQREKNEQYGWLDFGDVFDTGKLWRRWASMFYGFPNVMPRLYLRSGRRDAWDFHRVNTRHIRDIDICHLDNDGFGEVEGVLLNKVKGRRYGGNGCVVHFAANLYEISCDHHLEFMLLDYYLNGDLRSLEVAKDYLDAHAAARADELAMNKYNYRHTGGALRLFCEGYQAFWDPEYLSVMRQCADLLYQAWDQPHLIRRSDVYMNPGKILFYQLTGDERMRDLFLKDMDSLAERRDLYCDAKAGRGATLSGPAHAYWFTGDEKHLPFMIWQLNRVLARGIRGLSGNNLAKNATHAYQLPQVMALLAEVENLPEPKGPAMCETTDCPLAFRSNGAFYVHEEEDGPWDATLEVDLYRGGGSFERSGEWIERLDESERPVLRVIDPDGEEIQNVELDSSYADPKTTKDKPLKLTIPADGKTGTYVIVPRNMLASVSVRMLECSLPKRVVNAGDNWVSLPMAPRFYNIVPGALPRSCYFTVPAGTGRFDLELKTCRTRTSTHYGVRNADGKVVAENKWETGGSPRNDWEIIHLDAGEPEEDEIWSLTFVAPRQQLNQGEFYLRCRGVPGYLASSPGELFTPDPKMRWDAPQMEIPAGEEPMRGVDGPPGWKSGAYLAKPLTLNAREKGKSLLDAKRGTVEMWVKPLDSLSELANRNLLRCGDFSLYRRYNIGVYARIGKQQFQRFFKLPPGRWTHLAFTWQPAEDENADVEGRLYADGIDVGPKELQLLKNDVPEDWGGTTLTVAPGICVAGLRVSDGLRYKGNFQRPEKPFELDERTRVLCPFDGSGEVYVLGETINVPDKANGTVKNNMTK